MSTWIRKHHFVAVLLWTVLALGATEGILLFYYLNSWLTLPTL